MNSTFTYQSNEEMKLYLTSHSYDKFKTISRLSQWFQELKIKVILLFHLCDIYIYQIVPLYGSLSNWKPVINSGSEYPISISIKTWHEENPRTLAPI